MFTAKFNNRVPGTVYGMEEDATTTTMAISTSTTESVSSFASTTQETLFSTTQTTNTTETPISAAGVDTNVLIYVIYAVSVVGVVALLVVVILLCVVIAYLCCSTDKNKTKRLVHLMLTDYQFIFLLLHALMLNWFLLIILQGSRTSCNPH